MSLAITQVFLAQKVLLRACNHAGKPVYVTRVVDSMTGEWSSVVDHSLTGLAGDCESVFAPDVCKTCRLHGTR